jgi:hypothetical protein
MHQDRGCTEALGRACMHAECPLLHQKSDVYAAEYWSKCCNSHCCVLIPMHDVLQQNELSLSRAC